VTAELVEPPYIEGGQIGRGGMSTVNRASPKTGGADIALKRPIIWPDSHSNERLRREISVLNELSHPNVIPLLDHGVDQDGMSWYTMPIAEGSLKDIWESGTAGMSAEDVCLSILQQIAAGIGHMHEAGFIHRDVKPANILSLGSNNWVIADCGLVRRPVGETTAGYTGSATVMGTLGFIAPEAHGDPHGVTPAADIYSLGRVIAWLLTGQTPVMTDPLLPRIGSPWRPVVRELTHKNPAQRPQSMDAALARARELLQAGEVSDVDAFRAAVRDRGSALLPTNPLWGTVIDNAENYDFMIDDVATIKSASVVNWATANHSDAASLAEQMIEHLQSGDLNGRSVEDVVPALSWIQDVLTALDTVGDLDSFEDAALGYVSAVRFWDRYAHNAHIRSWLPGLSTKAGDVLAGAIRQAGEIDYFTREFNQTRVASVTLGSLLRRR